MGNRLVLGRRLVGLACFLLSLAASGLLGLPSEGQMPEIALGWPLLLHIERAVAAMGLIGFALLIIWRAGRGEFPIRFGQIEYEARVAGEVEDALGGHERRITHVEQILGLGPDGIDPHGNGSYPHGSE